jgi:hypothetical protein
MLKNGPLCIKFQFIIKKQIYCKKHGSTAQNKHRAHYADLVDSIQRWNLYSQFSPITVFPKLFEPHVAFGRPRIPRERTYRYFLLESIRDLLTWKKSQIKKKSVERFLRNRPRVEFLCNFDSIFTYFWPKVAENKVNNKNTMTAQIDSQSVTKQL